MITRREWLAGAFASAFARQDRSDPVANRIRNLIGEFEAQGFHRTGTDVDRRSGEWLADQVRRVGLRPALEPFALSRVDPVKSVLIVGDRRIEGLPLFDAAFTDANGVRGRLGTADSDADIPLTETAVNAAGAATLGTLRRQARHKAIVAITRGRKPGLCPSNADSFLQPFGPPVLQVSSGEAVWIVDRARAGVDAEVVAHATRRAATAFNVTAKIDGSDPELPPLVVMTPRSGWYWCASERGGGIACWLEVMRALRTTRQRRAVLFVASSGHELGHLGINAFIDRRPGIAGHAFAWMHFGANIGSGTDSRNTLQASANELDAMLAREMSQFGLTVDRRPAPGAVPGGEAEAVHGGGGRYVSVIGGNELFHHPADRGPQAINPHAIARFSLAFIAVARALAT